MTKTAEIFLTIEAATILSRELHAIASEIAVHHDPRRDMTMEFALANTTGQTMDGFAHEWRKHFQSLQFISSLDPNARAKALKLMPDVVPDHVLAAVGTALRMFRDRLSARAIDATTWFNVTHRDGRTSGAQTPRTWAEDRIESDADANFTSVWEVEAPEWSDAHPARATADDRTL